tara:strand:+ start:615 stop:1304 length:690 start_codon:yes stop_codon:yes gene_type:complete
MSSISGGSIAIIDRDGGDAVTVTDGRLDVNAAITVSSDDINIGNVVLQDDAGTDIYAITATSDSSPNFDARNLLGTHALLSARSDSSTTMGLTGENSTHNALHVAISDGAGIAHVNASNELEVAISSIDASTFLYTRPIIATAATNTGVAVGTGSTELIASSATRLSVVIVNDSDEVMYLAVEDAAVMNTGIRLNPNGGSYTEEMSSDAINAICASGSKNATVCANYIS